MTHGAWLRDQSTGGIEMEQYGEMPGLGVAAPETGPNETAGSSHHRVYHSLADPLTCTCPRCTEWRESVRDKAHAARTRHTKRHSLMELSQALATGEGPASLYELLRRCAVSRTEQEGE